MKENKKLLYVPLSPEISSEVVKLVSLMPISSENIFWGFN